MEILELINNILRDHFELISAATLTSGIVTTLYFRYKKDKQVEKARMSDYKFYN